MKLSREYRVLVFAEPDIDQTAGARELSVFPPIPQSLREDLRLAIQRAGRQASDINQLDVFEPVPNYHENYGDGICFVTEFVPNLRVLKIMGQQAVTFLIGRTGAQVNISHDLPPDPDPTMRFRRTDNLWSELLSDPESMRYQRDRHYE